MKRLFLFLVVLLTLSTSYSKNRKVVYIVLDGIPADYIERVHPKTVFDIAEKGGYSRAYTGGEIGTYSQTSTISAIGYMNILTGTWMNKHNVKGNSNLSPNYNYWSLFRIAKNQNKDFKTAIFSSWTDNRTVLIGEGKPETDNIKIDYVFDGYDLDKENFPSKKDHYQIFEIDSVVCKKAADCIKSEAPDLSWVYLWYTDSGYHLYGDGTYMDKFVEKTDNLISDIWKSVQYRQEKFDEDWMIIVTTDHGRNESGHDHGGQSERERSVWISTNNDDLNAHFKSNSLSLVDILPSVCCFMGFDMPRDVLFEGDGIPFIGNADISSLATHPYDDKVTLKWKCYHSGEEAKIYMSTTNEFKTGGKDVWREIGTVSSDDCEFVVNLNEYPQSKFYKFVVATKNNHITRWMYK